MNVLICAATEFEITPALQFIQQHPVFSVQTMTLITGVGLMAAAYQLTKALATKKPQFVIQAGVAGCFDPGIQLGEVVAVRSEVIGDAIVLENGSPKTLFDLGLTNPDQHPWKNGRLQNEHLHVLQQSGLKIVDSITVNEITTNPDRIAYYKNTFNAGVESLEGAALHYTALMEGIPFLQLRSVSNYIGERDKRKWRLQEAISHLNDELQHVLLKLFEL